MGMTAAKSALRKVPHPCEYTGRSALFREQSKFMSLCIPVAIIQAWMRYEQNQLALCIRHRMMQHVHARYLDEHNIFYRMSSLGNNILYGHARVILAHMHVCDTCMFGLAHACLVRHVHVWFGACMFGLTHDVLSFQFHTASTD